MGVLFMTLVEMFDAPPSLAALTLGLVAGGFALFGNYTSINYKYIGPNGWGGIQRIW